VDCKLSCSTAHVQQQVLQHKQPGHHAAYPSASSPLHLMSLMSHLEVVELTQVLHVVHLEGHLLQGLFAGRL
jgi:hypothetical protein